MCIFLHWNKKGKCHKKKHHHPGFEPRTPTSEGQQPTSSSTQVLTWQFIRLILRSMYLCVRIEVWEKLANKRKQHAAGGRREHGLGRYSLAGSGGASNVRHVHNQHTERWTSSHLGRLRLKTWSEPDFSIAEPDFSIAGTTWATLSSMYLCM